MRRGPLSSTGGGAGFSTARGAVDALLRPARRLPVVFRGSGAGFSTVARSPAVGSSLGSGVFSAAGTSVAGRVRPLAGRRPLVVLEVVRGVVSVAAGFSVISGSGVGAAATSAGGGS